MSLPVLFYVHATAPGAGQGTLGSYEVHLKRLRESGYRELELDHIAYIGRRLEYCCQTIGGD
jgi:hypothetical protein